MANSATKEHIPFTRKELGQTIRALRAKANELTKRVAIYEDEDYYSLRISLRNETAEYLDLAERLTEILEDMNR